MAQGGSEKGTLAQAFAPDGQSGSAPLSLEAAASLSSNPAKGAAASSDGQKRGGLGETASEFVSSLTAAVGGAVVFGLATRGLGGALSVPLAMALGGVTKYGVKTGLRDLFVNAKDRTACSQDLLWGGIDGLSGIGASLADQKASQMFLGAIGKDALALNVSNDAAQAAGRQIVKANLLPAIEHNAIRGIAGGAAGSLIWAVPHEVTANWQELKENPAAGLLDIAKGTAVDTTVGTVLGGALGGAGTALARSSDIIGYAAARARGEANVFRLNEYSLNDFHSNIEQLPRIKVKLDALRAQSAQSGIATEFVVPGDTLSGHINFTFTNNGEVELKSLADMGMDTLTPGNHEYDAPGGKFAPERFPGVVGPVLRAHPNLSLIQANLDLSAYPDYEALTKPYVVREYQGPNGPVKVASIGLVTREGAVGKIRYNDAIDVALKTIKDLNAQGISAIKLDNHLGMVEDQRLARAILDNNLTVAKITGAHSHDITAAPVWVSNKETLLQKLQFWKPRVDIPITQGGSSGRWLMETNLAIKPNGAADRYLTTARPHAITNDMPSDPALKASIEAKTAPLGALRAVNYDASATGNYSVNGVRYQEMPLGNLVADSIRSGLKAQMGDAAPDIVMVHSGGLRAGIFAGKPLTRLDMANVFINAGKLENEQQELVSLQMTGSQIKNALEYGVRNFTAPEKPSLTSRLAALFSPKEAEYRFEQAGNFVQPSGLKYSIDRSAFTSLPDHSVGSATAGNGAPNLSGYNDLLSFGKVKNVMVQNPDGHYVPLDDNATYRVVTRFHPLDKWNQHGLFGNRNLGETHQMLNATPVPVSQVDLLGDYIKGKTLDPGVMGKIDGRIKDLTPHWGQTALTIGPSIIAAPALSTDTRLERQ